MEKVEEEESKVFVGAVDCSSFMATTNKSNIYSNTNAHELVIDQHHHHQQTSSSQMLQSQQNQDHHHHHHQQQQISFGMMQSSSFPSSSTMIPNFINKDSGGYDLGELDDQALFLYLNGQPPLPIQEQNQNTGMTLSTLNIFPSQPMHVEPSPPKASQSTSASCSKRSFETSMDLSNSKTKTEVASLSEPNDSVKRQGNRNGPTTGSEQGGPKTTDPKTLRRLAQNREAARKSRLRKKAYIQQLETSRIKLTKIEQDLDRARSQGFCFAGSTLFGGDQGMPFPIGNMSSDVAVFDMEYARWLEDHHRLMGELRNAVQELIPENELRLYVDNCLSHYAELFHLKSMIAKSDVFHLYSGMWKTPAERCFMWMGGFRPSKIIKIIMSPVEPLSEPQVLGIYGLQQSTEEAEEALSQGLENLNQSLTDTIVSDALSCAPSNMANYMGHMALAMNKFTTLEGFLRQADNLRYHTFHQLRQILTIGQSARCFLAMAEYFHRLRALSSLWLARPKNE